MKTTYKVLSATGYDGRQKGDEFEADLDPFLEEWALERGDIEIVKGSKKTVKKEGSDV